MIQKQQQSDHQVSNLIQEKERIHRDSRQLNTDLMKANMQIQNLQTRIDDLHDENQSLKMNMAKA